MSDSINHLLFLLEKSIEDNDFIKAQIHLSVLSGRYKELNYVQVEDYEHFSNQLEGKTRSIEFVESD